MCKYLNLFSSLFSIFFLNYWNLVYIILLMWSKTSLSLMNNFINDKCKKKHNNCMIASPTIWKCEQNSKTKWLKQCKKNTCYLIGVCFLIIIGNKIIFLFFCIIWFFLFNIYNKFQSIFFAINILWCPLSVTSYFPDLVFVTVILFEKLKKST